MRHKPASENPLFGAVFVGSGLLLLAFTVFMSEERLGSPRFFGILMALVFVIAGLWLMGAHQALLRRFNWANRIEWQGFGAGVLCFLMGLLVVIGVSITEEDELSAPRWVALAAGAVFVTAGLWVMVRHGVSSGVYDSENLVSSILVAVLATLLGVVATWVVIGSGQREGTATLSFPLLSGIQVGGSDTFTRLIFAPGALLTDAIAFSAWIAFFRNVINYWRT